MKDKILSFPEKSEAEDSFALITAWPPTPESFAATFQFLGKTGDTRKPDGFRTLLGIFTIYGIAQGDESPADIVGLLEDVERPSRTGDVILPKEPVPLACYVASSMTTLIAAEAGYRDVSFNYLVKKAPFGLKVLEVPWTLIRKK